MAVEQTVSELRCKVFNNSVNETEILYGEWCANNNKIIDGCLTLKLGNISNKLLVTEI